MILVVVLKDDRVKVWYDVVAVGKLGADYTKLHVCFKDGDSVDIDLNKVFEWHATALEHK